MDEREFDDAWARIEEAAPVPLDARRVGEVVVLAVALHPDREAIIEQTRTGQRFGLRLMRPDVEAVERGEPVPIMCQLFLEETADSEFIEVAEVSVMAFAAEGATSHPEAGSAS